MSKSNKLTSRQQQSKTNPLLVMAGVIAFAALAAYLTFFSYAATPNGFYITPSSKSVTTGATFSVQVRLNHSAPVDTVQAYISYPSNLEVVDTPSIGAPFSDNYENSVSGGIIKMTRAVPLSSPSVTGDNPISTVTFRAKSAGSASLAFMDDTLGVNDGTRLSISRNNASYSVADAAAPAPTTPAPTSPTQPPSSTSTSPTSDSRTSDATAPRTSLPTRTSQPGTTNPAPGAPLTPVQDSALANETGFPNNYGQPNQLQADANAKDNSSNLGIIALVLVLLTLAVVGGYEVLKHKGHQFSFIQKPDAPGAGPAPSNQMTANSSKVFSSSQLPVATLPHTENTISTNPKYEAVIIRPTNPPVSFTSTTNEDKKV